MSENNQETTNQDFDEQNIELSPDRNKIFKTGLFYLLGIVVLSVPLVLLGNVLGGAMGISKSGVILFLFILILLPSYKIWKRSTDEIEKNEDYGYDGKLKFSYYLGMIGTTAGVTLIFIALLTGFIYLLKPDPFKADIGSFDGKTYTVKKLQDKLVEQNPSVRPRQLKMIFGEISYENFKRVMKFNDIENKLSESDIKKQYESLAKTKGTPNKGQIFNQMRKHFLRMAIYKESMSRAKKHALYQNLINTDINVNKFSILSKFLNYKQVISKRNSLKPKASDIKYVKNAEKMRRIIRYKQIAIYNRNHKNKAELALKQARKAYNELKQGKKWKKVAVKYNQVIPMRGRRRRMRKPDPNRIHSADMTSDTFGKYFGMQKGAVVPPIKLPYGWIVIKIHDKKTLTDEELVKKPKAVNEIKSYYQDKYKKSLDKMLEDKYRKHITVDYNLLFKDKESSDPFLKVAEEIYIPVIYFWKALSDKEKEKYKSMANLKEIKEYTEKKYIKPIMGYLEAKQLEIHKTYTAKVQIGADKFSRYIEAFIQWYLIPEKVDPAIAKSGNQELKAFYKKNARYFASQGRRRRRNVKTKPFEKLDNKTLKRVKQLFKRNKTRTIAIGFIMDKLLPKYKARVEKDYFTGKVPPNQIEQFSKK